MSISTLTAAMFQGGGIKADKRQCRGPRVQTVQVNAGGRRERQGQDRGTQNQGEEGTTWEGGALGQPSYRRII